MRRRGLLKSPVRENCTPGSVRGALRRPYRDSTYANVKETWEMESIRSGRTVIIYALTYCAFIALAY